jgi:hypothetical protein
MALELMEGWLECVWEHRPDALSKPRSIPAMDAFHGHLFDRIRIKLKNENTDLVLQPPDVSIKKPFKHHMMPG